MARTRASESEFHARCRSLLEQLWSAVDELPLEDEIEPEFAGAIAAILRAPKGKSATFRFVLPTQLIAKFAEPKRDARTIQKGSGTDPGSFDARSLANKVIVPFNRRLGSPLGTSGDPYVNNPLRVPEITKAYRAQQKDKERWDDLCLILDRVQNDDSLEFTGSVTRQVLLEVRRVLEESRLQYPAPQRISLEACITLLADYLAPRTGGRRLQAVAVAVFRTLGDAWGIYDEVLSAPATAADAPGDRPADIDCRRGGATTLAVEVKDQTLTLQLLEDKIQSTRLAKVRELLFLIRAVPLVTNDDVTDRIRREFTGGQNIYLLEAEPFFRYVLSMVGETGRTTFLEFVGDTLDELGLDYADRRAWADLLSVI